LKDITERVQAQESLQESEAHYRLLAENITDIIWTMDMNLRFTYVSPSVTRMLGYSVEEAMALTVKDILTPASLEVAMKVFAEEMALEETEQKDLSRSLMMEAEQYCKDGSTIYTEITVTGLRDLDGRLVEALGVARDITERVRAEQALRESEAQYRGLFERVPVGLYRSTPGGQILDANPVMVQMLGYPDRETLLATNVVELFMDPDYRGEEMGLLGEEEIMSSYEMQMRRRDGVVIWVQDTFRAVRDAQGQIHSLEGSLEDITEHKQAEDALRKSEERMRTMFEEAPLGIALIDSLTGHIHEVNPRFSEIAGRSRKEMATIDWMSITHPDDVQEDLDNMAQLNAGKITGFNMNKRYIQPDSSLVWINMTIAPIKVEDRTQPRHLCMIEDITERVQAQEKERRHLQNITFLTETAMSFVEFPLEKDIYRFIGEQLKELAGESIVVVNSIDEAGDILTTRAVLGMGKYSKRILKLLGRNPEGTEYDARDEGLAYLADGRLHDYGEGLYGIFLGEIPEPVCRVIEKLYRLDKIYTIGFVEGERLFGTAAIFLSQGAELENEEIIETFVQQASIAIQRQLAEQSLLERTEELARLYRASGILLASASPDLDRLAQTIVETILIEFKHTNCSLFLVRSDSQELNRLATAGPYADEVSKGILRLDGSGLVPRAIRSGEIINLPDVTVSPDYVPIWEAARSELAVPLKIDQRVIGVIDVQSVNPGAFNTDDERLMFTFAKRAALALENARLFDDAERRLERLASLRSIDQAITGVVGLSLSLDIVLGEVATQLAVDAVDVLLYDPHLQSLRFAGGKGFETQALQHTTLRLGEGYAGKAALERRTVHINNLTEAKNGLKKAPLLPGEGFVSYYGVPLIAKGEIKGVLELFHRSPLEPTLEWLDFLETLAGQAAIVIDNATLFNDLQRANLELSLAYDRTLEGWAQAVTLRDWETGDHTRRVTEMTLRLARALGIGDDKLVHVRRGAVLHDIGKLGIPDGILLKPGPLDDEEWEIMRQHPTYARDLLFTIDYLRPALDIPYSHHEKWDGSGYPQGLRGAEIPLAARIFAIVDVWDALNSDRPYRDAWPEEKIISHIQEQSGKHFDPQVVDMFLQLIKENLP
ncbi:MAG: PAS domain S-box protein, partial [Chloroflexi bacterium]|nr:PAS domain S-box protein [Chloroflexota bacterium]